MSEPSAPARTVLAGRYRLEKIVTTGPCTTLWRAVDEALARPIAVKILHAPDAVPRCADAAEAVNRFTASAVSVGRLVHPRIASTYDTGVDGGTPYIVTEWVDGEAVAEIVARSGPLSPAQAHTVAVQTAAALAYAHQSGIPHGQVDGHNVLLCADGNVKLTDFGVASAMAQRATDVATERRSPAGQDVRAAAALLYLALTGRSVNGDEPGLPPAPRNDGVLLSPQQVRAGVPRELDLVVMRTLGDSRRTGPPISDSAELVAALDRVRPPGPAAVIEDDHNVVAVEHPEGQGSRLFRLGAPAALAGVVVVAVIVAIVVGARPALRTGDPSAPTSSRPAPASAAATSAAAAAPAAAGVSDVPAVALPVAAARDFDPQANPQAENPRDVPLAYDGDPATAWETDRYKTAAFGQLKTGVGVVFDLGRPVSVDQLVVRLAAPGASLELRAADSPGTRRDDFALVASAAEAGRTAALRPTAGVARRYWLLWVTRLPAVRGGFRAGVSEVAFTGRVPR